MKGKSCEEATGPHRNRFATEGWSHTGSIPARGEPWIGCGPALSRTDKACLRSPISPIHQDKRACGHGRLWSDGVATSRCRRHHPSGCEGLFARFRTETVVRLCETHPCPTGTAKGV